MPRVYDCFPFFNELELLEIRLHELADVVDKFVLVEATTTHQGEKKPLYYKENSDKFARFRHKITHIVVDFPPRAVLSRLFRDVDVTWAREHYQREMILAGLQDCSPDDIIIISDADEIPCAETVAACLQIDGIKIFKQRLFYYWLNCENVTPVNGARYVWLGPVMANFSFVRSPQRLRDLVIRLSGEFHAHSKAKRLIYKLYRHTLSFLGPKVRIIDNGGWHFSYLGGVDRVREKLKAFAHTEYSSLLNDINRISDCVMSGLDLFDRKMKFQFVPIDETFPKHVVKNPDRFKHLIWPGG
ncbi:MAG: hypothetical protein C4312_08255 [Thermoflexus sp.]